MDLTSIYMHMRCHLRRGGLTNTVIGLDVCTSAEFYLHVRSGPEGGPVASAPAGKRLSFAAALGNICGQFFLFFSNRFGSI